MIVSTKKPSTQYNSSKFHRAYGIQNWLTTKGFCQFQGMKHKVDKKAYEELLTEFCCSQQGFNMEKARNVESLENYINNRFSKFAQFCMKKFKKQ